MSQQTIRPGLTAAAAAGPVYNATAVLPAVAAGAEPTTVPTGSDAQTMVMPRVAEPAAAAPAPAAPAPHRQHAGWGGEPEAAEPRQVSAGEATGDLESVDAYEERRAREADQAAAAQPAQPGLAGLLAGCGASATRGIEIYAPSAGAAHGSLAGSVYACADHVESMTTAIHDARLTAYLVPGVLQYNSKRCGDGMDFTGPVPRGLFAPSPAESTAAADSEPEHYHAGGSAGGPGGCSAECACGVAYSGFDSLAEALELLNEHIGRAPEMVPAAGLAPGMLVATGDPDAPGAEVRHVEPTGDGEVLVVLAGARTRMCDVDERVELVDQAVVDAARERVERRARRAVVLEGLRTLLRIAEADPDLPLPTWRVEVSGSLDTPEQVERFAAAIGGRVDRRYGRAHAEWSLGGDRVPALQIDFSAADASAPADDPIRPVR